MTEHAGNGLTFVLKCHCCDARVEQPRGAMPEGWHFFSAAFARHRMDVAIGMSGYEGGRSLTGTSLGVLLCDHCGPCLEASLDGLLSRGGIR